MAKIRIDIFNELNKVKELIKVRFPEFKVRNLCKFLSRIALYHYDKKNKMLLGRERNLYNLLIENGYNPYTVYRWALLERVPEDIKFQLKNHYLSQKKASKLFFERQHETDTSLQIDIKQVGLRLIKEM